MRLLRQNHQKGDHLEVVHASEFALARMSAAGVNRLATARSCFLPTIESRSSEQFLCGSHVLTAPGSLVKAGAGSNIW